jgi:hypothetical protein
MFKPLSVEDCMRRWFACLAGVLVLLSCTAFSQNTKAAVDASRQWLAQVDAGNYAASWDKAAQRFKDSVPKEQWAKMLRTARDPLGKVVSRKLKSATYRTSLPGMPDGQYVMVQYDSSFEHKKSVLETLTPMLEKNGEWRVAGYFIK